MTANLKEVAKPKIASDLQQDIQALAAMLKEKRKDIHDLRDHQQGTSLQVELIGAQVDEIKDELKKNTEVTQSISAVMPTILEIIEILDSVKGGIKVLGYLGKALSWLSGIAVSLYGLWEILKK